jgi:integrase
MPCGLVPYRSVSCENPPLAGDIAMVRQRAYVCKRHSNLHTKAQFGARRCDSRMGERRRWGKIRRMPSGRWQASYSGPDTVRHFAERPFTAKIDAEGWLSDERRLVELHAWTPPAQRAAERIAGGVTVAEYGAAWIEQRNLKPRTRIGYESTLARHISSSPVGRLRLRSVTSAAVRSWYASLGDAKPGQARAHAYQLLHAILATAVHDELLPSNPAHIPRAMAAPTRRQPVILDAGEVAALADAIRPELRALVLVAAWCGPRWSELIELRRHDIGKGCSTLTVTRGATHRQRECRIDTPKSGRGRIVVIPPHIRQAVAEHLKRYVDKPPGALLFRPMLGGCHLNDRVFRSYYNAALDDIGRDGEKLPRPTIHDLRHFAGTSAARVGNLRRP